MTSGETTARKPPWLQIFAAFALLLHILPFSFVVFHAIGVESAEAEVAEEETEAEEPAAGETSDEELEAEQAPPTPETLIAAMEPWMRFTLGLASFLSVVGLIGVIFLRKVGAAVYVFSNVGLLIATLAGGAFSAGALMVPATMTVVILLNKERLR